MFTIQYEHKTHHTGTYTNNTHRYKTVRMYMYIHCTTYNNHECRPEFHVECYKEEPLKSQNETNCVTRFIYFTHIKVGREYDKNWKRQSNYF